MVPRYHSFIWNDEALRIAIKELRHQRLASIFSKPSLRCRSLIRVTLYKSWAGLVFISAKAPHVTSKCHLGTEAILLGFTLQFFLAC